MKTYFFLGNDIIWIWYLINDLKKNVGISFKISKNARKTIQENTSNIKVYKKFLKILQLV